jgi:acyl-CoA thioester hydrolase
MAGSPENQPFTWPIRVYYEDTDAQGLVYYANYFRFMERARTEWLRSMGIEQDVLLNEGKRCFVVVDTQAEFIRAAKFNEQLVATASLKSCARATFEINQEIYRNSLDGDLICRGSIRAAFINTETQKPVRLPDILMKELSR